MKNYLFTSESVTEGHPDKVCDQISDAILDELLRQDPESRVACETMITTGWVIVSAEITTKAEIDYDFIIREMLKEIGYTDEDLGTIEMQKGGEKKLWVSTLIKKQSPHISQGVDSNNNHEINKRTVTRDKRSANAAAFYKKSYSSRVRKNSL